MNLLLSCILLLISACAGTPDDVVIEREIQAAYDKLADAYERQDVDTILASSRYQEREGKLVRVEHGRAAAP